MITSADCGRTRLTDQPLAGRTKFWRTTGPAPGAATFSARGNVLWRESCSRSRHSRAFARARALAHGMQSRTSRDPAAARLRNRRVQSGEFDSVVDELASTMTYGARYPRHQRRQQFPLHGEAGGSRRVPSTKHRATQSARSTPGFGPHRLSDPSDLGSGRSIRGPSSRCRDGRAHPRSPRRGAR